MTDQYNTSYDYAIVKIPKPTWCIYWSVNHITVSFIHTAHYWLLTGFSQYSISCCFYATSNIKFSVMNCTWVFIALAFQCEHEKLLWHPLVENFIFQKFWLRTFPLLLLNMLLYCAILVALNSFVLVVPRPGPDSATCETQHANSVYFFYYIIAHALVKLIILLLHPQFSLQWWVNYEENGVDGMNYKGIKWGYNLLHPSKYICGSPGRGRILFHIRILFHCVFRPHYCIRSTVA